MKKEGKALALVQVTLTKTEVNFSKAKKALDFYRIMIEEFEASLKEA